MYRTGNAPTSWGVELPDSPNNPPWAQFLDEVAEAGYSGVELGPYGYLPTDPGELAEALAQRGLTLTGGYVLSRFWDSSARDETIADATRVCSLLHSQNAGQLVLISAIVDERTCTAGRSQDAQRLQADDARLLADAIGEVVAVAADYGLQAGIHPHAGTHLEFADEIESVLADERASNCGVVVDTGHLTYAGIDPAEFIASHAERVQYVHAKDLDASVLARMVATGADFWEAYRSGVFCVLGSGIVDFAGIREVLAKIGYEGWLTVEQDADPSGGSAPCEDARRSRAFLEQQGLAR